MDSELEVDSGVRNGILYRAHSPNDGLVQGVDKNRGSPIRDHRVCLTNS